MGTVSTVELFAGIGGFRLAADACGLTTVWANDLCPKAARVYRDAFEGSCLATGDIRELLSEVPPHDLLTAGFPCQPFSSAGKKRGILDPRGSLFEVITQVIETHQPEVFVLENVKRLLSMKRGSHFATILSALSELPYVIEWRLLNAADFGLAQNRERVFITGRKRGSECPLSAGLAEPTELATVRAGKPRVCPSDDWAPIEDHGKAFPKWGLAVDGKFTGEDLPRFLPAQPRVTLQAVLEDDPGERFDFTESTLGRIAKSEPVDRFVGGVQILHNQGGGARMGYTVFGVEGLAPTLTSTASRHYERYKISNRYRRLSNIEYSRLQGFPDDHCDAVSVYDQYALYGNAVPPPMAEWVIDQAFGEGIEVGSPGSLQLDLFRA